jgi:hypothetical protein
MVLEPIHSSRLERKEKYIVHTQNGIYKGLYLTQPRFSLQFPYIVLKFVTSTKNGKKYNFPEAIFDRQDTFYHIEDYINEIKDKANKARQQMETRALNKILKNIINETFEW